MESNILNKRTNWRTGYFIQSSKSAHWPQRQIDLTNEDENKMIFANFKEEDKGRSRKRICTCENKGDAAFICKAVNNYDSLLEALKELDSAATCFADDHKHYYEKGNYDKIDEMLAAFHNAHLKAKEIMKKAEQ